MSKNVEIVRSLYADFAAGNVPSFLGKLAPNVHWNEAEGFPLADRNPYVGPQAIVEGVFARVASTWRDFAVEVKELVGSGDLVVMLGRYRGVVAVSGKKLDVQVAHLWWLAGGRVVRFQQMVDTAGVARTLVSA
jgi:ketosteroid isomerase-like protein